MSSSSIEDKLEQLNLTNDEVKNIAEAFKKEEFCKLFAEYAEEISDPVNRAQYEKEITQLENERGMDIKFVKPTPGHVLKTTVNGSIKAFINVCHNDRVGKPSSKKSSSDNGKHGLSWSIPHLFAPTKEDFAKDKQKCKVYDFVVHPDTYRMGESNFKFRKMINDMALEGVEKMFNVSVDTKNMKSLKMKYKGTLSSTVIRNKIPNADIKERDKDDLFKKFPYPYSSESSEEMTQKIKTENEEKKKKINDEKQKTKVFTQVKKDNIEKEDKFTEPKYDIKYQSHVAYEDFIVRQDVTLSTRPRNILLDIYLPLINSTAAITLDVFPERVYLISHKPAKYKLDVVLPYKINEDSSSAKFDKSKHKLSLVLPVIPAELSKVSFINDEGMAEEEEDEEEVKSHSDEENIACRDVLETEVENKDDLIESGDTVNEQVKEDYNEEMSSEKDVQMEEKILEEINNQEDEKEEDNKNIKKEFYDENGNNSYETKKEIFVGEMTKATGPDSGIEDNTPNIEETYTDNVTKALKEDANSLDSQKNLKVILGADSDKKIDMKEKSDVVKEEIVVVHEKECPKLQGILKSRTSSESSSSHESGEEMSPQCSSSKKCVSFSDHVDETVYVINQSVSTLHATLKNRKKKKEKREAAKEKQQARRRKNSGSVSSGDELCHLQQHTNKVCKPQKVRIDCSKKVDSDDDAMDSEGVSSAVENSESDVEKVKLLQQEEVLKVRMAERKTAKDLEKKKFEKGRKRKGKKGRKCNATEEVKEECVKQEENICENKENAVSTISSSITPLSDTMLSWNESDDKKNTKCSILLENDQVFSLDLN